MTMGKSEAEHRQHKDAVDARAEAARRFGIGSVQYAAADAKLTEAFRKLPKPTGSEGPQ
jgi:hypothetical protein